MKRKVGELFNKPIVQGNENVLSPNEILVEQKGNTFSLKERVNGEIKEIGGSSIEYRDISGINPLTRINLVDQVAFMVKLSAEGTTMITAPRQGYSIAEAVGLESIVAISTDLNAKSGTRTSDGLSSITLKEVLIQQKWWEEYNSCPTITKEEFYTL